MLAAQLLSVNGKPADRRSPFNVLGRAASVTIRTAVPSGEGVRSLRGS